MLGFLLAPFSPLIIVDGEKIAIKIESRKAFAETRWYYEFQPPLGGSNVMSVGYETETECNAASQVTSQSGGTIIKNCFSSDTTPTATGSESESNGTETGLKAMLRTCGISRGSFIIGCFIQIMYFLFVSIPSWLMLMTAQVFDTAAALTLSDQVYRSGFISTIWTIVRDFSNVFFILILLYAAFQVILGLGHGGGKKIVASVILIALMVNFSLFISRVVVDAGNVLGLIFYNKISTDHVKYQPVSDPTLTGVKEKDLAGALVSSFAVNNFFSADFFNGLKSDPDNWETAGCTGGCVGRTINNWLAASLIVTYGLIAYSLAWIFLIVGISFIGRLATLIMLMVISPIAFVTATVPTFKGIDTIGFDSWLKKLFQTSFVVAVFMAILYLVSEILKADIFDSYSVGQEELGIVARLMLIFVPALLILIFLKKGKEYSVKASGEITGALISGAKMLGGLALGGAALGAAGAAVIGRNTVGSTMNMMKTSQTTRDAHLKNLNWNPKTWGKALQAGIVNQTVKGRGKGVKDVPTGTYDIKTRKEIMASREGSNWLRDQMLGGNAKDKQNKKDKSHATHALDEAADKVEKGKKYSDLDTSGQNSAKEKATKSEMAKFLFNGKDLSKLSAGENAMINKAANNDGTINNAIFDRYAQNLGKDPNKFHDGVHMEKAYFSKDTQSTVGQAAGWAGRGAASGTYDVRNLKGGALTAAGLAAAMFGLAPIMGAVFAAHASGGLRSGLQKLTGVDHGDSKKDFLKDLKATLDSTLKNLKFDIKVTGDGHGGGDDHSAGHGGGGGHH